MVLIFGPCPLSPDPGISSHSLLGAITNFSRRCWGNAETTVTIIAASIPMLRVIIREAASSRQTYGAEYYKEGMTTAKRNATRNVTISRGGPMGSDVEMAKQINDDNSSDKGILDISNQDAFKMGRIVKTHNFTIEYHSRDSHPGGH